MPGKKGNEGCEVCGEELLLFKCKYCGKAFCEQHKAPEKHECAGMEEYRRQQAMGVIARPGTSGAEEKPEVGASPSSLRTLYKRGVFAIKLLSVIAVIAASIFALVLLVGYINVNTPTYTFNIPVNNAAGATVVLTNYKNATDPTYDSLVAFLKADDTIKNRYVYPNFTCADFARTLHDRAEASGIKCGFVAIEFYNATIDYSIYDNGDGLFVPPTRSVDAGHGLDAFNTVDRGLVYVDASSQTTYSASESPEVRIAYIQEGSELNEIDLSRANDTSYAYYESYKKERLTFIQDQRDYYRDRSTGDDLTARAIELNARKSRIGPFYFPQGVVKKVDVYW